MYEDLLAAMEDEIHTILCIYARDCIYYMAYITAHRAESFSIKRTNEDLS